MLLLACADCRAGDWGTKATGLSYGVRGCGVLCGHGTARPRGCMTKF